MPTSGVPKPAPLPAWLFGLLGFAAFETAAYYGLRLLTAPLGQPDQYQPANTIVSNWVKTATFVVGHLLLAIAALLWLSTRLPRRYRGLVQGWFYVALLMSFVLLLPLFG